MIPLKSKCVRGVEYHPDSRKLYIWFHGRGPYPFYRVPESVYVVLLNAVGWHGEYYNQNICGIYVHP